MLVVKDFAHTISISSLSSSHHSNVVHDNDQRLFSNQISPTQQFTNRPDGVSKSLVDAACDVHIHPIHPIHPLSLGGHSSTVESRQVRPSVFTSGEDDTGGSGTRKRSSHSG